MKRKIIYTLFAATILLLLCAGFNSCSNEADLNGYACMVTSISNVKTRAGELVTDDDATIEKIRVFVFVPTGQVEKNILYVKDTPEFMNPFSICDIVQGDKEIFIVANESATLNLGAVANKSELLAKLADEISGPVNGTQPLLMTGNATVELREDKGIEIELTHVAAKISLKFKKDTDADVTITKVSLLSNAGKTTLFPVPPATAVAAQTYWDWIYPLPTPQVLTATATAISGQDSIYLYENLVPSAADKTHATQLEVEALYNNIPTKYRVYINENIATPGSGTPGDPNSSTVDVADHLYKIKRNFHYQLTGTIKNLGHIDGLLLQVKVLPWELIETEQIFEEDPIGVDIESDHAFTANDNTTSITNPLEFTFELTQGPEGATWEATLDNGLEFGFVDVTQTYGGIGETKTITIKPLKPFDESITRTTHFYITVTNPANGEKQKVELISGVTQILITQVEN